VGLVVPIPASTTIGGTSGAGVSVVVGGDLVGIGVKGRQSGVFLKPELRVSAVAFSGFGFEIGFEIGIRNPFSFGSGSESLKTTGSASASKHGRSKQVI